MPMCDWSSDVCSSDLGRNISNLRYADVLSHFSRVRLFVTPWTAAYQAPPSMGFYAVPKDLPQTEAEHLRTFVSSSIIPTTCRIPGCEAFGNIHKFPSFHCLRIVWGVCSHASSQAALPESLLMRFGDRRQASEFKYLSPSHPSGSSQCTSHKHPVSCIDLDW